MDRSEAVHSGRGHKVQIRSNNRCCHDDALVAAILPLLLPAADGGSVPDSVGMAMARFKSIVDLISLGGLGRNAVRRWIHHRLLSTPLPPGGFFSIHRVIPCWKMRKHVIPAVQLSCEERSSADH